MDLCYGTPWGYQEIREKGVQMSVLAATATPAEPVSKRSRPALRFLAHYLEMVVVMLVGMSVLGGAFALIKSAAGFTTSDAADLTLMGVWMTVPMVAWMMWRGHSAAATREMAGAMIVPTLLALALLGGTIVTDLGDLMAIEHTLMFTGMFAVMLFRRDEYTGAHSH